jgi:N-acetylmuramic acid 6-phosphate etherase
MHADYPIEVLHGAETISGSTRLDSGTAQKLVYNAISSIVMIRLGKVVDTIMIDMQLTNAKLVQRAINMIRRKYPAYSEQQVFDLLNKHERSVRNVLNHLSD